jgi:HD-GYP domain-containing protein (c-di-GMP phosphodiesterase class II)
MPTPLDPTTLTPGAVFRRGVYTRSGERLVAPGVVLSPEVCRSLAERFHGRSHHRSGAPNLLLADSPGDAIRGPAEAVEDDHDPADLARRHRARVLKAADKLAAELGPTWETLPRRSVRTPASLEPVEDEPARWPSVERLARYRTTRVERIAAIHASLLRGEQMPLATPDALVSELQALYWRFPGRFAQLAGVANEETLTDADARIHRHAWSVTVYAVLIAMAMGFEHEEVRIVGLAALLADAGMHLLPREAINAPRPLTDLERNRMWRHPAYTVTLLEQTPDLPETVRLAIYQHHERPNGTGYPTRASGAAITDAARVLSVADAFAAAHTPRPHRPGKHRYPALNELNRLAALGNFDQQIVRALTRAVGLYPVDALVTLNTGERAIVIENNREAPDRPAVRVLRRDGDTLVHGPRIDLGDFEPWALFVLAPANDPARSWARPRTPRSA